MYDDPSLDLAWPLRPATSDTKGEKQKDHSGMMATGTAKSSVPGSMKEPLSGDKDKNAKRRTPDAHLWPPRMYKYIHTPKNKNV